MRPRWHMISWHPTSDESKANELRNEVIKKLSKTQQAANTTRGSTPGLVNPRFGEAGGRVDIPRMVNGQGTVRGSRPLKPKADKAKTANAAGSAKADDGSLEGDMTGNTVTGIINNNHIYSPRLVGNPLVASCTYQRLTNFS